MDEMNEITKSGGSVRISEEVIITITSVAISEVAGVSGTGTGLVEGFARKFVKKPANGGIKVTINDDTVTIDINIIMDYGVRIPEVAWNVQDAVKKEVELMTGMKVDRVNVRVVGVDIPQDEPAAADKNDTELSTELSDNENTTDNE